MHSLPEFETSYPSGSRIAPGLVEISERCTHCIPTNPHSEKRKQIAPFSATSPARRLRPEMGDRSGSPVGRPTALGHKQLIAPGLRVRGRASELLQHVGKGLSCASDQLESLKSALNQPALLRIGAEAVSSQELLIPSSEEEAYKQHERRKEDDRCSL